jgi:hypothetical protein
MKTRIFSLIMLLLFLATGCGTTMNPNLATSTQGNPPVTSTPFRSVIATPSPVSTLSSVPISTIRATLSPVDSADKIRELMQSNGNCSKPCFWGIIPGTTSYVQATDFLDSLGSKALTGTKDSKKYYNTLLHYKDVVTIGLALVEENTVVGTTNVGIDGLQSSQIRSADWLALRPDSILKNYGQPSSISVILGEGQNGAIGYELLISYDKSSFFIAYKMEDISYRPNTILHTCPLAEAGIRGFILSIGPRSDVPTTPMYSIQQVTNFSKEEFSAFLIEKGEKACLDFNISTFYKE